MEARDPRARRLPHPLTLLRQFPDINFIFGSLGLAFIFHDLLNEDAAPKSGA